MKLLIRMSAAALLTGTAHAGTSPLSLNEAGELANGLSRFPVFSGDGRWVFFSSDATNLVASDTNGTTDVFARDLLAGTVVRLSVDSAGQEVHGASGHVTHTRGQASSFDGRFVAFYSLAPDLVGDDGNSVTDLFLRDRDPDGNGIFDEPGATTIRITRSVDGLDPDGLSGPHGLDMSSDGRWIAFYSEATNLVEGDSNGFGDVFLYDRIADTIRRVSIAPDGTEGDRAALHIALSRDGRYMSYYHLSDLLTTGDSNNEADIHFIDRDPDGNGVFDEQPWSQELISLAESGDQGDMQSRYSWQSDDGRYVVFESAATNLVTGDTNNDRDLFLRDLQLSTTQRISVATGGAQALRGGRYPYVLSRDGRYTVYRSSSSDLVADDTNNRFDVFLYDRINATTERVSRTVAGDEVNGHCQWVWLSDDNRYVAYDSEASNILPGGTPAVWQCYVFDRGGPCPGDVNRDGTVDFADLNLVLLRWNQPGPGADADASGLVDFGDLNTVLSSWSTPCGP
ncbi:MAG: PD40 domain-containing protein [Phycisphaerales bacterium]|nr:PD40 domain-containing protein [Phycisphaerales bacterium]